MLNLHKQRVSGGQVLLGSRTISAATMRAFDYLLEQPLLFNLSQIPFTQQKFERILKHTDLKKARHILDIGCGAGSNTSHFVHADYLGIDINEKYIHTARRRYKRRFSVADVARSRELLQGSYDFVLINSFLHHIDEDAAIRILKRAAELLETDGYVHSIEVVLPEEPGIPRWLAKLDRGRFPRPLSRWRQIFESQLETVVFEPFSIRFIGINIMDMVYFKGRAKRWRLRYGGSHGRHDWPEQHRST
jgi:SAM-dependent methyltransferase